jgi:hypothetical protein
MKKSGLQKKIAFIFDGEDAASDNTASPATCPTVQTLSPSPVAELPAVNGSAGTAAIGKPVRLRPQPVCKRQTRIENTVTPKQAMDFVKTRLFSSKSKSSDSKQQKKMMMLIAILGAVFVGVLIFSLGSAPSKAAAADSTQTQAGSSAGITPENAGINTWKMPEPYPAALRDPMKLSSHKTSNGLDADADSSLVVRGIVYTETKPTAIISGQIVGQGDTIAGVKVVKIAKDFVEFEKETKRWKQQVEK